MPGSLTRIFRSIRQAKSAHTNCDEEGPALEVQQSKRPRNRLRRKDHHHSDDAASGKDDERKDSQFSDLDGTIDTSVIEILPEPTPGTALTVSFPHSVSDTPLTRTRTWSHPVSHVDFEQRHQSRDVIDVEASYGRRLQEENRAAEARLIASQTLKATLDLDSLSSGGLEGAAGRLQQERIARIRFQDFDFGLDRSSDDVPPVSPKTSHDQQTGRSGGVTFEARPLLGRRITPYPGELFTALEDFPVPPDCSSVLKQLISPTTGKHRRMTPYPTQLATALDDMPPMRKPSSEVERRESYESAASVRSEAPMSPVRESPMFASFPSWLALDELPTARVSSERSSIELGPHERDQAYSQNDASSSGSGPELFYQARESPDRPASIHRECARCKQNLPHTSFVLPTKYCVHPQRTCMECLADWAGQEIRRDSAKGFISCWECERILGNDDVKRIARSSDLESFVTNYVTNFDLKEESE
jgi:hypothetical protein